MRNTKWLFYFGIADIKYGESMRCDVHIHRKAVQKPILHSYLLKYTNTQTERMSEKHTKRIVNSFLIIMDLSRVTRTVEDCVYLFVPSNIQSVRQRLLSKRKNEMGICCDFITSTRFGFKSVKLFTIHYATCALEPGLELLS